MRFQIPQYIETEDKIIGPLTLKQFLYLAGAGAVSFVTYFLFTFFFWLIMTGMVGAFAVALAFVKVNGQPFIKVVAAAIRFMSRPRLYLWKRKLPEKIVDIPVLPEEKKETGGALEKLKTRLETRARAIPKRERPLFRDFRVPETASHKNPETPSAPLPESMPTQEPKEEFLEIEMPSGDVQKAKRVDYAE